jgi:hypothetical protein
VGGAIGVRENALSVSGARQARLGACELPNRDTRIGAAVRVADLLPPDTLATRAAREVVTHYSSAALVNHCERA